MFKHWIYSLICMVALAFSFNVSAVSPLVTASFDTPAFTLSEAVGLPSKTVAITTNQVQVTAVAYTPPDAKTRSYSATVNSLHIMITAKMPERGYTKVIFS